jgi:hypothetical protein
MKRYITIDEAVEHCNEQDALIPSALLCIFPNNFGINLCAVKGFEIDMTEDNQYKSLRVDFLPVEERTFAKDNELC